MFCVLVGGLGFSEARAGRTRIELSIRNINRLLLTNSNDWMVSLIDESDLLSMVLSLGINASHEVFP
jgi:hypothetical protein